MIGQGEPIALCLAPQDGKISLTAFQHKAVLTSISAGNHAFIEVRRQPFTTSLGDECEVQIFLTSIN